MEANFAFLHFIRQIVFKQESEEKDIWQNEKSPSQSVSSIFLNSFQIFILKYSFAMAGHSARFPAGPS